MSTHTDVLVVGAGPSGLALAGALARRDLSVRVVSPQPPTPFAPTYGAWLDDLPAWAQACADQVWTDVRVYTGPEPTPLARPYALLDNGALLAALLAQGAGRVAHTTGRVRGVERRGGTFAVQGEPGETWTARLVVDASGHGAVLLGATHPHGAAWQTAYGVVADFDRPPSPPGAMVWMDYRAPHGESATLPTFLYAMHLGGRRYFVEETSLIARPAPSRAQLRERLHARLAAQGTPPRTVRSEEWVAFPMNTAAPAPGEVLGYGAAAGRVHPISGFQVARALHDAPVVAGAIADALAAARDPAAAAWAALWPPEQRQARELHLMQVSALLGLPGSALADFFGTFFALPPAQWRRFLDPGTPTPELARTMLRVFAGAPWAVRAPLARAGVAEAGTSLRALRSALKAPSRASHPAPGAGRHPGAMTNPDPRATDTDQHDTIEEGMQGADGSTDANGLDPHADRDAKLRELDENLASVQSGNS